MTRSRMIPKHEPIGGTMNHCFDCNSSYSEPGTCNCFAVGGKRYPRTEWTASPTWVHPVLPYPVLAAPVYTTRGWRLETDPHTGYVRLHLRHDTAAE